MVAKGRALAALCSILTLACAADYRPRIRRPPLVDPAAEAAVVYPTPAQFRYHPSEAAAMNVRVAVGDDVLFAGARGERWLLEAGGRKLRAAARLAPEEIVAVQHMTSSRWLFLGASGATYETREPLGPFVRSSAPYDSVVRVSASQRVLSGVRRDGVLVRSVDGGGSWTTMGPERRFVDVVLADGGAGLALAIPERLFATQDDGASWTELDVPSVGALSLRRSKAGEPVVTAVTGEYRFRADARVLLPIAEAPQQEQFRLPVAPPKGPDAGALEQGRAARIGSAYIELAKAADDKGRWRLWEGQFEGTLEARVLPELDGCRDVRIAGFASTRVIACFLGADLNAQQVHFFRSSDNGRRWEREPFQPFAHLAAFRMAVGSGEALLVSGVCPERDAARGCAPHGVSYRRPTRPQRGARAGKKVDARKAQARNARFELAPSVIPGLSAGPSALAFSPDGLRPYALGRRTKGGEFALFVSADRGATFVPKPLDGVPSAYRTQTTFRRSTRSDSDPIDARLSVAEDGTVAVVLRNNGGSLLVVADAQGATTAASEAPADTALLGAVGARALAVSPSLSLAWETLDGGASWRSLGRLPLALCASDPDCRIPVSCAVDGCTIGDELSRVGWGGQSDDGAAPLAPAPKTDEDAAERRMRTPVSCALESGPWKDLPGLSGPPSADQAAIGSSAWFAVATTVQDAAVTLFEGKAGGTPRLELTPLLRPLREARSTALYVSYQVEGIAALRYPTPESTPGETHLKNVEVAWSNLFEGRTTRARIADAGPYRPGDYERAQGLQRARPNLLSISKGGVYLRIHAHLPGQPTLFLDGERQIEVPATPWPKHVVDGSHLEMVHVDGAHVPIAFYGQGAALVRASQRDGTWAFESFATGLHKPAEFGLTQARDIAYHAGRAGYHLLTFDAEGRATRGQLFPFRANGAVTDAPLAVPAQVHSADPPSACSPAALKTGPRVVVPYQPGTRHPIVVSDASEPLRVLVTGGAVMSGSPEAPCTAALDAGVVKTESGAEPQGERAILPLANLEHSWLFRVVRAEGGQEAMTQYRMMSCRFDPRAEIPADAFRVPGALGR